MLNQHLCAAKHLRQRDRRHHSEISHRIKKWAGVVATMVAMTVALEVALLRRPCLGCGVSIHFDEIGELPQGGVAVIRPADK